MCAVLINAVAISMGGNSKAPVVAGTARDQIPWSSERRVGFFRAGGQKARHVGRAKSLQGVRNPEGKRSTTLSAWTAAADQAPPAGVPRGVFKRGHLGNAGAGHRRDDELRNAHAAGDDEGLAAEIDQDHLDFPR
jgi:hypothetical protein